MMTTDFGRYALIMSIAAALISGCGGSQLPSGLAGATPQSRGITRTRVAAERSVPPSSYQVLYSFAGGSDGAYPGDALIDVNGTLYGTTSQGGGSGCAYLQPHTRGCGTVFTVATSGKERVLYSFSGPRHSDGWDPEAGLADVSGTLYGTTADNFNGCDYGEGCGTVYSVSTSGTEKVLYAFHFGSDGYHPAGGLIDVKGRLYSTTSGGGGSGCLGNGCGTVFSVTTSSHEKVVYRFRGPGGADPLAGLIEVGGVLYGTTFNGGSVSYGTVFSVTPAGVEKVLHSFQGPAGSDGADPSSGLIDVNGMLYGTTFDGGHCNSSYFGCGTVYRVSASGVENVVYAFAGGSDGAGPVASLTELNGVLYGTTQDGGTYGKGVVFSISTSGKENVLHSFGSGSDGKTPVASLLNVNGTLYGTTWQGGVHGKGTVFALTP